MNRKVRNSIAGIGQLLALMLAVVLVYSMAGSGSAKAYVPATFEPALGSGAPGVKAEMTVSPATPDYGQRVNYTGTLDFTNYENMGDTTITVAQSPMAKFAGAPSTSDFQWSVAPAEFTGPTDLGGGKWSFTAKGIAKNAKVTFRKPATVAAKDAAAPGDTVVATISATTTQSTKPYAPQFGPLQPSGMYSRGGNCYGTMTSVSKPLDQGGWLMDLKFGDSSGKGNVVYMNRGADFVAGSAPAGGHDAIQIMLNGRDITQEILGKATYESDDPSQPLYVTPPAGTKFIDSLDWKYDVKTYTGNAWLPAGATVQIARQVEFHNCVFPSPSFDPSTAVYTIQLGRPNISPEDSAVAMFVLPGETRVPAACEDLYWVNEQSPQEINQTGVNKPTNFQMGLFTDLPPNATAERLVRLPDQAGRKVFEITGRTGSMAMTQKYPDRMYYISYTGSLFYVTQGNPNPTTPNKVQDSQLPFSSRTYSAGFNKKGMLFTWYNDNGVGKLYRFDVDNPSAGWKLTTTIRGNILSSADIYDLAFDGEDNLYAVTSNKNSQPSLSDQKIIKIPASQWRSGKVTLDNSNVKQVVYTNPGPYSSYMMFGLAFAKDGKLYIGYADPSLLSTSPVLGDVELDDLNGSGPNVRVTGYPVNNKKAQALTTFSDLASCSFGEPSSTGPKFKLQKSVVDPVTGTVVAAGEASPHKLQLQETSENGRSVAKGNVTYYVTVSNIGGGAGDPGKIADFFSLGNDKFRLQNVRIDGAVPNGLKGEGTSQVSFYLTPGEMAERAVKVYKLTATVVTDASTVWGNEDPIAQCKNDGPGDSRFGIFNQVTMNGDSDGPNNNDACVPVEPQPKGELYLFKAILDQDGKTVTAGATPQGNGLPKFKTGTPSQNTSVSQFQLSANGPTPVTGTMSASGSSYTDGVGGTVRVGDYSLAENAANAGLVNFEYGNTYDCYDKATGGLIGKGLNKVSVANQQTVLCYVTNKPIIPFHIEKDATHPAAGLNNVHYGATVEADANGKVQMKYTVKVTNDSDLTGNTGRITDIFRVPAGLKWDGSETAKVSFNPGASGGSIQGMKNAYTEAEFTSNQGVLLATSIRNMSGHSTATIDIEIPLMLDEATFEENAETLETCEAYSLNGDNLVTAQKGVPNTISLENENPAYSPNHVRDNIACIPVKKPDVKFHVEKLATDPDQQYPAGFRAQGSAAPSHVGKPVVPDSNGNLTLKYTIVVTNDSGMTASSGAVKDHFRIPAGLQWQAGKNATVAVKLPNGASVEGFNGGSYSQQAFTAADGVTLATAVNNVPDQQSAVFTVEIPLQLNPQTFSDNKANLANCVAAEQNGLPGYVITDPNKGSVNTTSLQNEWQNNANWQLDNVACIPVKEVKIDVVVRKMDAAPVTEGIGLKGAEFSICATQPRHDSKGKLLNNDCTPMTNIPEVAGRSFAEVSESEWNTHYATYGKVCEKYLPEGVKSANWADRHKYGAAYTACIHQYTGTKNGGQAAQNLSDGSLYWGKELQPGKDYWIVETKAPLCDQQAANGNSSYCYSLLPEPVKVSFNTSGVITTAADTATCNPFSGNCTEAVRIGSGAIDIFPNAVVFHDPRQAQLPKSGGTGPGPIIGLGALTILCSGGYLFLNRRRRA